MADAALRKALVDALLTTSFIQYYDWVGTDSSGPSDEYVREVLGGLADQLAANPTLEIRLHACAACRWEQGFGAREPIEHTCVARKGQPPTPDPFDDPDSIESITDADAKGISDWQHPGPKQCRATWTSLAYGPVRCGQEEGHIGTHRPSEYPRTWLFNLPDGNLPDVMGAHWLSAEDGS